MVTAAFDAAGIRYFLGGSIASALYGEPRSTRDIDLVAAILPRHIEPSISALGSGFYAEPETMRDAVAAARSFNVIHLDTMVKVDVFTFKADAFGRSQLRRRVARQLSPDDSTEIYVASAEDTVLAKLKWYRDGGQVSDRHWNDVLGVLKSKGRLWTGPICRKGLVNWASPICSAGLSTTPDWRKSNRWSGRSTPQSAR